MFALHFAEELPDAVRRELENIVAQLTGKWLVSHNEDGTLRTQLNNSGDFNLNQNTGDPLKYYRGLPLTTPKGTGSSGGSTGGAGSTGLRDEQWWKKGPWTIDDPNSTQPHLVGLRPNDLAAGTYNNYAPPGIDGAVALEINPTGNVTLTGLSRLPVLRKRFLLVRNKASAYTITLKHQSTSSTVGNRFSLPNNADIIMAAHQDLWLYYDLDRAWTAAINATVGFDGTRTFGCVIDGGGSAIVSGDTAYLHIPYSGTIKTWRLVADQSGSIVVDVWKDTYANFPPTDADSITNGNEPELSSATKAEDSAIANWTTTTVTAGDVIGFHVDSVTTVERVSLSLTMELS